VDPGRDRRRVDVGRQAGPEIGAARGPAIPGRRPAGIHGDPGAAGRPARLEADGQFDNLIQHPTFSPDGRFVLFSSDRRPDRGGEPRPRDARRR
jgi:hypothetical protein